MNERYDTGAATGQISAGNYAEQTKQVAYLEEMNITPRQNIERRIKSLRAEIARLEATEKNMESSNLLDVPIQQLRNAMQF